MFTFDLIQSGLVFVLLLAAGERVSRRLKSALPSALVSAIFFIALIWLGIIPAAIIESAGLTTLTQAAVMFIIIGLGASTNIKELTDNWKVVTLAALTYLGQVFLLQIPLGAQAFQIFVECVHMHPSLQKGYHGSVRKSRRVLRHGH